MRLAFAFGLLLLACGRLTPASGAVAREPPGPATPASPSSPAPTPSYHPGPNFTSGVVVRWIPGGVLIESVGREIEVDLSSVIDVWKETSVPASAIEVGDHLDVNGTAASNRFFARYIWANIGRLDGVIQSFDGSVMVFAYQRPGVGPREVRVELSPSLEIVRLTQGTTLPGDRADLSVGRSVGMVLYRPRDALPRATRIWLSLDP